MITPLQAELHNRRKAAMGRMRPPAAPKVPLPRQAPAERTAPRQACATKVDFSTAMVAIFCELSTWPAQNKLRVADIQTLVACHFNVSRADIVSTRRTTNVVLPRQIAMYLSKLLTPRSLPEIGRRFGDRDHTTVLHAVRRIGCLIESDEELAALAKEAQTLALANSMRKRLSGTTMMETVAKAMHDRQLPGGLWEDQTEVYREKMCTLADAAIESMMVPTWEMVMAGIRKNTVGGYETRTVAIWQAMLRAAAAEAGEGWNEPIPHD